MKKVLCNDCKIPLVYHKPGFSKCPQCGVIWELNEAGDGIKNVTVVVYNVEATPNMSLIMAGAKNDSRKSER